MRIYTSVIIMVTCIFVLMLHSPALAVAAVSCQGDSAGCFVVDSDTSMQSIDTADASLSIESSLCCVDGCSKAGHKNSHCHDLHCHKGACCSLYAANTRNFNANQSMFKINLNYEEHFFVDDLISSIFKPPQI